jgi:hypothetical protein
MRGGIAPRGGAAPPSVGGRGGGVAAAPAAAAGAASSGGASKDKDVHHLAKTISCHAWSGDRTRLALCPNDNTVEIWQFDGAAWNKEFVLNEVRKKMIFFFFFFFFSSLSSLSARSNCYWHRLGS